MPEKKIKKKKEKAKKKRILTIKELHAENKRREDEITKKLKDVSSRELDFGSIALKYDQTRLVLMVKDPYWVYTYWILSEDKKKEIELYVTERAHHLRTILRVYDETKKFGRKYKYFDVDVPLDIGQWYIFFDSPEHSFRADLGLVDKENNFYLIAWSNTIIMPKDEPSDIIDAELGSIDEAFPIREALRQSRPSSFVRSIQNKGIFNRFT